MSIFRHNYKIIVFWSPGQCHPSRKFDTRFSLLLISGVTSVYSPGVWRRWSAPICQTGKTHSERGCSIKFPKNFLCCFLTFSSQIAASPSVHFLAPAKSWMVEFLFPLDIGTEENSSDTFIFFPKISLFQFPNVCWGRRWLFTRSRWSLSTYVLAWI